MRFRMFLTTMRMRNISARLLSLLILIFVVPSALAASEIKWSFEQKSTKTFPCDDGSASLDVTRNVEMVDGINGKAIRLTRKDGLRTAPMANFLADGVFSIQGWIKVEWSSRRNDLANVVNFVESDSATTNTKTLWRLGFVTVPMSTNEIPRDHWQLALMTGAAGSGGVPGEGRGGAPTEKRSTAQPQFSTSDQPLIIEPWQWTHVAFVGDGKNIKIFRNAELVGTVAIPAGGLGLDPAQQGVLQVNGAIRPATQSPWSCDMRLDSLVIADEAVTPNVTVPKDLSVPADTKAVKDRLANLGDKGHRGRPVFCPQLHPQSGTNRQRQRYPGSSQGVHQGSLRGA